MFRRGKDKNGDTNGTDDGIYEGAGLESSADLIKDWSGGYHSFFFWRNLCGKTGGKSRSEDKSGDGRDSDPSDGTSSHSCRIFPASDLQSAAAVWCCVVWKFWNQGGTDLAWLYSGGNGNCFSTDVPEC